ncbi:HNH endonuclease [Bdellovibrio sp. HCB288]|uniref:HNH endonuclease n=1 Tax=Bdellovibrio sp. HCB288 TaxID=3394355 RepID=UPI0039B622DC
MPLMQGTHKKVQADESVRFELTLTKEAFAKIKNAQELLSHAVPTQDLAVFLEYLADKVIKHRTGVKHKKNTEGTNVQIESVGNSNVSTVPTSKAKSVTANVAVNVSAGTSSQRISSANKKILIRKQSCCQWVDTKTGRRCESKWLLQIDHKHSRWAQGAGHIENLQVLCAAHNKLKYMREAGIRNIS